LHVDHAEYEGGMNAVQDFREIATDLRWKHDDKVRDDPLAEQCSWCHRAAADCICSEPDYEWEEAP
jgi:hypothetical protein